MGATRTSTRSTKSSPMLHVEHRSSSAIPLPMVIPGIKIPFDKPKGAQMQSAKRQARRCNRTLKAAARALVFVLALGSLQLLASCGTTPSGQDSPLPSVPSGLLQATPAPVALQSLLIEDALANLRTNATLLGECRVREQETHLWMRSVGLTREGP